MCEKKVSVSFGTLWVPLDVLVVRYTPFNKIIVSHALEYIPTNLDYGRQQVTLSVGKKKELLPLLGDLAEIGGMQTDSEGSKSPGESHCE